jgi:hypothetical protein
MGRTVYSESMLAKETVAEAKPDLSFLQSGRYIVKIICKDQVYTKDLIKN